MRTVQEIDEHVSNVFSTAELTELDAVAQELAEIASAEALALRAIVVGLTAYRREDVNVAMAAFEEATARYSNLHDLRGLARAALNHGRIFAYIGDRESARKKYMEALDLYTQVDDPIRVLRVRVNLGLLDTELGEIERALETLTSCIQTAIDLRDDHALGHTYRGIATIHLDRDDYGPAIEYYRRAIEVYERHGDYASVTNAHNSIANIHFYVGDYVAAAALWHQTLEEAESRHARNLASATLHNLGNLHHSFGEKEQAVVCYERSREIGRSQQQQEVVLHADQKIGAIYCESGRAEEGVALLEACIAAYRERGLDEDLVQGIMSLAAYFLNAEQFDRVRELLASIEHVPMSPSSTVGILRVRAELAQRDQDPTSSRELLMSALSIAEEHGFAPFIVQIQLDLRDVCKQLNDFEGYIKHNELWTKLNEEIKGTKVGQQLATQTAERRIALERAEHQKNLAVLHSTLPKEVADRVARGEVVNDHFDNATVIFLDIVGFTTMSSGMSSQDVISLLDDVFTQCDAICEKHGVTKIKTIGDSYMAVAFDSVVDAARCAIEMNRIEYRIQNTEFNEGIVQYRIGMHCGPVTAGVIGTQRLQYDVWGDTVNTASRMESSGEAGRIQVTESFALNLRTNTEYRIQNTMSESENAESNDSSLVTTIRGVIDIKGKGTMTTYWLS